MTRAFPEFVVDGVLIAPFAAYLCAAFILLALLRPVLGLLAFDKLFMNPSLARLSLYVLLLAALLLL